MKTSVRSVLIGTLVVPAVLLVGGCGTSESSDSGTLSTAGPDQGRAERPLEPGAAPDNAAPDKAAPDNADQARADEESAYRADGSPATTAARAVISQGHVSVRTEDIEEARFELRQLLDTWDGSLASEESDADEDGNLQRARLELRVPSARFAAAMEELGTLGTLVDRRRSTEDVTTRVIDNEARVRSARLSLARIQALLAKAEDLTQVIAIEAQLSQRQADLDSLVQQQAYLADQTSLATITLYLSVPDAAEESDDEGFWSGLKAGWESLGTSTTALLTGLGAVVPFAAVLSLVTLPLWLRRRRRARAPESAPGPATTD